MNNMLVMKLGKLTKLTLCAAVVAGSSAGISSDAFARDPYVGPNRVLPLHAPVEDLAGDVASPAADIMRGEVKRLDFGKFDVSMEFARGVDSNFWSDGTEVRWHFDFDNDGVVDRSLRSWRDYYGFGRFSLVGPEGERLSCNPPLQSFNTFATLEGPSNGYGTQGNGFSDTCEWPDTPIRWRGELVTSAGTDYIPNSGWSAPMYPDPRPNDGLLDVRAVNPYRIVDSRPGTDTFDGKFQGFGMLPARSLKRIDIRGAAGSNDEHFAQGVTLNLVSVNSRGPGHLTVFACDETVTLGDVPLTSSLNHGPGQTVANNVTVDLGEVYEICVYTHAETHIVIDVTGYLPDYTRVETIDPARLYDSRSDGITVDGTHRDTGRRGAKSVTAINVAGRGGVDADADAVILNVTAVTPTSSGYLTVFPCGTEPPNASTVNYVRNSNRANAAWVKLDSQGRVCVFSSSNADIVVDVNGFIYPATKISLSTPYRIVESRTGPGMTTIDGQDEGFGRLKARETFRFNVADCLFCSPGAGRGGIPKGVAAVFLNVVAVNPEAQGYLTVHPCRPSVSTSSLNYDNVYSSPGQSVFPVQSTATANLVIVPVDEVGDVCIFSLVATDIVVDVSGYATGF